MMKFRFYLQQVTSRGASAALMLLVSLVAGPMRGAEGFIASGLRVTPERWNKEANFEKLVHWVHEACKRGAKLVITHEDFMEGYVANIRANPGLDEDRYRAIGESIDGALLNKIRSMPKELKTYLLVGFAERREGKMFNSVVVFSPEGDVTLHYSKMHNAHEEPYNTEGTEFPVAYTPLGRLGTLICYDRQLPETACILAIKGLSTPRLASGKPVLELW